MPRERPPCPWPQRLLVPTATETGRPSTGPQGTYRRRVLLSAGGPASSFGVGVGTHTPSLACLPAQAPCTQSPTGTLSTAWGRGAGGRGGRGGKRPMSLLMPLGTLPHSPLAPHVSTEDPPILGAPGPPKPPLVCLPHSMPRALLPGPDTPAGPAGGPAPFHSLQSHTWRHDPAMPGPLASRDSWRSNTSLFL